MQANNSELNSLFEVKLINAYKELKKVYDHGMTLHSDRNESSRRNDGRAACLLFMNDRSRYFDGDLRRDDPVVFCIPRRYSEFVEKHYSSNEHRFAEWFFFDWLNYLAEEHRVGDPSFQQDQLTIGAVCGAMLTQDEVMDLLVYELAYKVVLDEHIEALNGANDSAVESEPKDYVTENEQIRRTGAFDRCQSTAFIVTLIDALTRHSLDLREDTDVSTPQLNIYNLNVSKLAQAISLVTGLSPDNIRKDINDWRNDRVTDNNGKLKKVRESLLSFGIEVDTTILNEAIVRKKN